MPIYDYSCSDCGKVSEILVHHTAEDVIRCPECGSSHVKKLPVAPYAIRNGSRAHGTTCCGRTERCDSPPCSKGDPCRRDRRM
ncbi:MAG: hypothetical protein AMS17_02345 [Spirochaetes bacterium DG_61]|nr:MAG: hypothetical protein AMS17_02345 [Spirochaetes bacterium DG_61]